MDGQKRGDTVIFSVQKVAHMAAFFLARREGPMSHLKLIKLMYLADRLSMERYDAPMSDDAQYSMKNGPILSNTLNLLRGVTRDDVWSDLISPVNDNQVKLSREFDWDELDELSRAELVILDEVFAEFGRMKRWEIVNHTHTLLEWVDPGRSCRPIDSALTFKSFGASDALARDKSAMLITRQALGQKLHEMS